MPNNALHLTPGSLDVFAMKIDSKPDRPAAFYQCIFGISRKSPKAYSLPPSAELQLSHDQLLKFIP